VLEYPVMRSSGKLLEAFGFGNRIGGFGFQLEPGVVANTTTALVVALIALASEAWALREQPLVMLGVMAVTLIMTLVYLFGTWRFAERTLI